MSVREALEWVREHTSHDPRCNQRTGHLGYAAAAKCNCGREDALLSLATLREQAGVEIVYSQGRAHLKVGPFVVATEALSICPDPDIPRNENGTWARDGMEHVVRALGLDPEGGSDACDHPSEDCVEIHGCGVHLKAWRCQGCGRIRGESRIPAPGDRDWIEWAVRYALDHFSDIRHGEEYDRVLRECVQAGARISANPLEDDSECPVGDPDCPSRDGECHDACEAPSTRERS